MIVHPLNTKYFRMNNETSDIEKKKLIDEMSTALMSMLYALEKIKDSDGLTEAQLIAANQIISEMCR